MRRSVFSILLLAGIALCGCLPLRHRATPTPASPKLITAQVPSLTPAAVLTRVQGEVYLRQAKTGQDVLARFGDYLYRGDVIETAKDARAEAMCSDGACIMVDPQRSVTVTCGERADPVYERIILRVHRGQVVAQPRLRLEQGGYRSLPLILSPRDTFLLSRQPTIRWRAVEGAQEYEVVVSKQSSELWRATTPETELLYPATELPLEQDMDYRIQVTARTGPDEESSPTEKVWAFVLSQAEVEQAAAFETQIGASGLTEDSRRFLLAAYHMDLQLYDVAIAELTELAQSTAAPLPYRLLGDAYLAIELYDEARQSYQKARDLAQARVDRLAQAEAHVGLGHVDYGTRDYDRALQQYRTAQSFYRELGWEDLAETVDGFLDDTASRMR